MSERSCKPTNCMTTSRDENLIWLAEVTELCCSKDWLTGRHGVFYRPRQVNTSLESMQPISRMRPARLIDTTENVTHGSRQQLGTRKC